MRYSWYGAIVLAIVVLVGCGAKSETVESARALEEGQWVEPDYIAVQHILIAFAGSVDGKEVTRTKAQAQQLAQELLERAKGGEDFDALVKEYTDDSFPGIYELANFKAKPNPERLIYARNKMVPAFGDVGFRLAVGEVGMAPHDDSKSPYGWHIIKRIK